MAELMALLSDSEDDVFDNYDDDYSDPYFIPTQIWTQIWENKYDTEAISDKEESNIDPFYVNQHYTIS